jgi:putative Mg2+ transporter-C (MgtC) family protein
VSHADLVLLGRVALAALLSFIIGFEREVRGAAAGDRTYALIGIAAAAVTATTVHVSPQAIAGVITGVGFVGAGLVFRAGQGTLRGITSAATIFAVSGIGVVAGTGHALLSALIAAMVLLDLEVRHIPLLRAFDARRYNDRFANDAAEPVRRNPAKPPGGAASP